MRYIALILSVVFCLAVVSPPLSAGRSTGSIALTANPSSIVADGKSVATVSAQVRDRDGNLVPDGTEVRFTASSGVIEDAAETSAGVARVKLVASDIPGVCTVSATWIEGQAANQMSIEFVDAAEARDTRNYISIDTDDYLAYSMDQKTVEAIGNVTLRCRSLRLEASEVQVNLEKRRIVARGMPGKALKISNGKGGAAEGDIFSCFLDLSDGILLSAAKGGVHAVDLRKPLDGDAISAEKIEYMQEDLEIEDLSDTTILVKASGATVFPDQKIQFRRAKVYVGEKRVISLPLYVLSLTGAQDLNQQYVGYSSSGISLNLPWYYSLTPSSSGAFVVRHGQPAGWGWYGQKAGWFLDLQQSYSTLNSEGSLTLSQITGNDWGAHFTHNQKLDSKTDAYLFLEYPAHKDFYGTLTLNRSLKNVNLGLNLYDESFDGNSSMISDFTMQTRAKPVGKTPFKFAVSTRTRYAMGDLFSKEGLSQSIQANVFSSPMPLSKTTNLRTSFGLGYLFGETNSPGVTTLANVVLSSRLSNQNSIQLAYRYADRAGFYSSSSLTGKQSLTASLILGHSDKWRASIWAVKSLDYSTFNVFGDFSYRFARDWRFGVRSTVNEFRNVSYNDLELALGRRIGSRELMAVWSKSQKKVMFELGSSAF